MFTTGNFQHVAPDAPDHTTATRQQQQLSARRNAVFPAASRPRLERRMGSISSRQHGLVMFLASLSAPPTVPVTS